jgi:hypothetical protein
VRAPRSRRPLLALVAAFALPTALTACRETAPSLPDAPPDSDGWAYPPPRTDAATAVGGPDTLEIATWNIENFPAGDGTPRYVADLIASLAVDVLVVEEIADEAAWRELLERLREHDGVLSSHVYSALEYQKIGVIYRTGLVRPEAPALLFEGEPYAFPRPPLSLPIAVDDGVHRPLRLELIGVHLKAGVTTEDSARRKVAVEALDAHLRAQVDGGGEDEIILAGDYNEVVTTAAGQANLAPILGAPERYTLRTQPNAAGGEISYVGFGGRLLDHITTTAGLAEELAGARVVIPRLHATYTGYETHISDHLPVILVVPLAPL